MAWQNQAERVNVRKMEREREKLVDPVGRVGKGNKVLIQIVKRKKGQIAKMRRK